MFSYKDHPVAVKQFLDRGRSNFISLRLAELADAEFILSLRTNPALNRHLSATVPTLHHQRTWMHGYAERHALGLENYFIILQEGAPVGTVRTYDYHSETDSFCCGSWIISLGSSPSASIGSILAVYDLAFDALGFAQAHFEVRQANLDVWKLHERMGAKLVRETTQNRFYHYQRADYDDARPRFAKIARII